MSYLSEFTNVADTFTLERAEIGRDTAVFQVDDTREGLVE